MLINSSGGADQLQAAADGDLDASQRFMDGAMVKLGNAIHTMQDATSPSHKGFQEWNEGDWARGLHHAFGENEYPEGTQARELEGATKWAWDMARTGNVSKEVFSSDTGFINLPKTYTEQGQRPDGND